MFHGAKRRWAVMLSSPEQVRSIPEEHLELSTRRNREDGGEVLMYRDNLTAYKAANYAGAQVLAGYLTEISGRGGHGIRLESGELLLFETPGATVTQRARV